jgi:hypothetical protein
VNDDVRLRVSHRLRHLIGIERVHDHWDGTQVIKQGLL